jgi:hypothetical protein
MAGEVNLCLAVNGGTLSGDATEGCRDGNFSTTVHTVNHQGGGTGYTYFYLYYNGDWQYIYGYSGSGCCGWSWDTGSSGATYDTGAPWYKVTGMKMTNGDSPVTNSIIYFPSSTVSYIKMGTNGNGNNDVVRAFACEMQAWGKIDTQVQVIQY